MTTITSVAPRTSPVQQKKSTPVKKGALIGTGLGSAYGFAKIIEQRSSFPDIISKCAKMAESRFNYPEKFAVKIAKAGLALGIIADVIINSAIGAAIGAGIGAIVKAVKKPKAE